MNLQTLKSEIAKPSLKERRELIAYIVSLNQEKEDREQFRHNLAEKIDDKSPECWMSLEDVERTFPND